MTIRTANYTSQGGGLGTLLLQWSNVPNTKLLNVAGEASVKAWNDGYETFGGKSKANGDDYNTLSPDEKAEVLFELVEQYIIGYAQDGNNLEHIATALATAAAENEDLNLD